MKTWNVSPADPNYKKCFKKFFREKGNDTQ